ncbi:hypothetical protein [Microbacterium lushaniae]|uniref:Lipoprotein n=1 Tax=Microbacterium lushaniae TaxID=2614639 RepID=A0A5J6L445_9MICO|nr:hypothetical protein [Microbacterium lushaniae]QEW03155.1 hypothetical protein F6J85_08565 [Microbacterium lushaniae]
MTTAPPRRARAASLLVLIAAATLGISACTAVQPRPEPSSTRESAPEETTPAPEETAAGSAPVADALAERDEFFATQGQPVDGSLPTPQTPEQQEFLDQQRAYVESQGGTWDEFYDGVALAVTLDACETSILNGHEIDVDTARLHIDSSPLIAEISGGDADATQGLASIMVFGTGFICPADAPQWEAAFTALYS